MEIGGATRDHYTINKANRWPHSEQEIGWFKIPPKLMIVANWFPLQKISPLIDGICMVLVSEDAAKVYSPADKHL